MVEYAHQKDSEYPGKWWIIKNLGQDPEKTENNVRWVVNQKTLKTMNDDGWVEV